MSEIPFISYLVTCKNEGYQLQFLLELLYKYKENAECIVLTDDITDIDTLSVINNAKRNPFFKVENHPLNRDYGSHKNVGKSFCKGRYIFQIDADEIPSQTLMDNLKDILESNPQIELFWLPRINDFKGVTDEHAKKWGWKLDPYEDRQIVQWPDPQTRIFKNLPHIKWEKKLHERVVGAKFISHLPNEFDFALIHNKTMEKQEDTNNWYAKNFSVSENRGI